MIGYAVWRGSELERGEGEPSLLLKFLYIHITDITSAFNVSYILFV